MAADPAFVAFFEGAFQRALEVTRVPGMGEASWDRRAAYLLWLATERGQRPLIISAPAAPEDIFA